MSNDDTRTAHTITAAFGGAEPIQLAGCCAYCLTVLNESRQAVTVYRGNSLCDEHLREHYRETTVGPS